MNYSILLPYYNRPSLRNTLASYAYFYKHRTDFEVVIVEDLKNTTDADLHTGLVDIVSAFIGSMPISISPCLTDTYNPSVALNIAANRATGTYLILSNPECIHAVDLLAGLDDLYTHDSSGYVVCGCKNVTCHNSSTDYTEVVVVDNPHPALWLQHSVHNNRRLHFTSSITKDLYLSIGGFCEDYAAGIGYEDDDLLKKIDGAPVSIYTRDDLLVLHQDHSRAYQDSAMHLSKKNAQLYRSRWSHV